MNITIYHKTLNPETRIEKYTTYHYIGIIQGGKNASSNKGYATTNDIQVRLFYKDNNNMNINNFAVGDIIYNGIGADITEQNDLADSYNITSIQNNVIGSQRIHHIHLGGK